MDTLQQVRNLQFIDKSEAEALLLSFLVDELKLDVVELELTPSAISLNSFNGFLTLTDGTKRFFKSHTESDTVINEYYNSNLLSENGYYVIQPVYSSTEVGKQILLYEVIESPSVFVVAWDIENGKSTELFAPLKKAQNQADDDLFNIYTSTLKTADNDLSESPVHQLFYHRLVGGRLNRFYGDGEIHHTHSLTIDSQKVDMVDVRHMQWQINGQIYSETLNDIIERAILVLKPQSLATVIGHGDAHNGNVFFQSDDKDNQLLYFDPAFAGHHSPLFDLVKPLFHNVFAMWMYFPEIIKERLEITVNTANDTWVVTHNWDLPAIRQMFWDSKVERTLKPIILHLNEQELLPNNWREIIKLALFCCPFLTMNLADQERFHPNISLLGLALSVEMGSESNTVKSLIDKTLDEIESLI